LNIKQVSKLQQTDEIYLFRSVPRKITTDNGWSTSIAD